MASSCQSSLALPRAKRLRGARGRLRALWSVNPRSSSMRAIVAREGECSSPFSSRR